MTNHPTMRAAILDAYGTLFRVATVGRPAPAPGQVLVRIAASGVNPLDAKIHAGAADHARHPLPAILGIDMAGTVEALGVRNLGTWQRAAPFGCLGGQSAFRSRRRASLPCGSL